MNEIYKIFMCIKFKQMNEWMIKEGKKDKKEQIDEGKKKRKERRKK